MSIVILGGNERMNHLYIEECKKFGCKAKVFSHLKGGVKQQFGSPDLFIVFTSTVSHKMLECARCQMKKCCAEMEMCHQSSLAALNAVLKERCRVKS